MTTTEFHYLFEQAKRLGFVTIDVNDLEEGDAVAEAYSRWCHSAGVPFIQIALGSEHSAVTFSLMEMEAELSETAEDAIRKRLPQESLMDAGIVIEPDYCLARWIRNETVFDVAQWLFSICRP